MPVISEPHKELVGGGTNAKYVKECKEMYLGGKGIEKIRGFEDFINLEVIWLNNNKLKKINNLDNNPRVKELYAQDNQICTLRGSLPHFHFLEKLDLSNNQLRDLDKLLGVLEKFKFLTHLNLKGNPCCEEPDYLLHVVYRIPSLMVLDQHVITQMERTKAKGMIGGDVATLTVAFMKRVPPYDLKWDEKVPERSVLEQQLGKDATRIRDTQSIKAYEQERALFAVNPYPETIRGKSLPPNAGTVRAMQLYSQHSEAAGAGAGEQAMLGEVPSSTSLGNTGDLAGSPYKARDRFTLYSTRMGESQLLRSGTQLTAPLPGGIGFQQQAYQDFVTRKTAGRGGWQVNKTTVRI